MPVSAKHAPKPRAAEPAAVSREGLRRALYSRSLMYFSMVAEELSIRGAARRLNIASSAVNRQILMLEQAIGTDLFERRGRSLALSPIGKVLAKKALETQAGLDALIEEVDAIYALRTGSVRMASIDSFACGLLPEIVTEFSRNYPMIRIGVSVQPSRGTNELVASGEADIGFTINPPARTEYLAAASYPLQIGALMAPSHPLARRRKVSIKDCQRYPILRGTRSATRGLIEQIIDKREVVPHFIESNSSRFKAALLMRGDYIAFSPILGLEHLIADGRLVRVPLTDARRSNDRFAVIVHPTGLGPAPRAFLDFCYKMIAQYHPQLEVR